MDFFFFFKDLFARRGSSLFISSKISFKLEKNLQTERGAVRDLLRSREMAAVGMRSQVGFLLQENSARTICLPNFLPPIRPSQRRDTGIDGDATQVDTLQPGIKKIDLYCRSTFRISTTPDGHYDRKLCSVRANVCTHGKMLVERSISRARMPSVMAAYLIDRSRRHEMSCVSVVDQQEIAK